MVARCAFGAQGPKRNRRFVEMEIKHGRVAMAGFLGVITTYSGIRWPGYLSEAEGIKFEDLPGTTGPAWAPGLRRALSVARVS